MEIQTKHLIESLTNQRNNALDEAAQLRAAVVQLTEELKALKAKPPEPPGE